MPVIASRHQRHPFLIKRDRRRWILL